MYLSGIIIISGGYLHWSSVFNGTVSFKQALAATRLSADRTSFLNAFGLGFTNIPNISVS